MIIFLSFLVVILVATFYVLHSNRRHRKAVDIGRVRQRIKLEERRQRVKQIMEESAKDNSPAKPCSR